jgi:hypothetical protein
LTRRDAHGTAAVTPSDLGSREAVEGPFHRIKAVRQQERMSLRQLSRIWHLRIRELRRQEEPGTDLVLSQLYRWQSALKVPAADLLVDSTKSSPAVLQRARLVRVMKTVMSIRETARSSVIQGHAQALAAELAAIMPELKEIGPWHSGGQQRTLDEYGRVALHLYPHTPDHDLA